MSGTPGTAEDVALVLHTSGTTSRPKRVPLTHANQLTSARAIGETLRLGPDDRCLNLMPLFHIHGLVAGLLAPIVSAGSVVCPDRPDADAFLGDLKQWEPTWYSAVPTIHQTILSRVRAAGGLGGRHTLRLIRSSSAALPPSLMMGLEETFGVPVIESYGMTEAAHQMASNPLPPRPRKPGSVGPAAGPEVAILGPAGDLLPPEVVGEVVIRGPSVTRGYEGATDNATAWVGGWFRTGDQGRLDADGYLFLTGRLKELINRGGEKIAPREVDEVLLAFEGVAEAVAFAVPHPTLGEDVAAAVVPQPGARLTEEALRLHAFGRLPAFKVPGRILLVGALPKGATGKLQRTGLADRPAAALSAPFAEPATPMEQQVAGAFAAVLERPRVGRMDNFFALGGDSLRATRVLNRLQPHLGFDIPPATLFRNPVVARFAVALDQMREALIDGLAAEIARRPPAEQEALLRSLGDEAPRAAPGHPT